MAKKSLITVFVFCLIALISTNVFAMNISEGATNTLNGIRDGVQNMANDAGGALENAKNGIENMMNNDGNTAGSTDNDAMGMTDNSTDEGTTNNGATAGDYTASRTTASDVTNRNGMTSATTWIVLAIVGIAIVALVWYYGTQKSDRDNY